MSQQRWIHGTAIFGSFAVILLLIGLFWPTSSSDKEAVPASATTTSTTGSTTTVPPTPDSECLNSWGRSDSDKAGNRWIAEGIPAIKAAKTPEEARAAAGEWARMIRKDPVLLAGGIRYILHQEVKAEELFDDNGCATAKAVDLVAEMEMALALSSMKPEEAPATGYNSGADPNGGGIHVADNPGIQGDRTSVRIDLADGTTIWVMARCGNPVTMSPPTGVPKGPTDNNPPETPPPGESTTTTTPGTTTVPGGTTSSTQPSSSTTEPEYTCPPDYPFGGWENGVWVCKDGPWNDPDAQGNNRPGGGGTAPPVTGPATPPEAGPPPTVYVPPAPPATPTTRPPTTAPPSPPTTAPPPNDPEVTAPTVIGDPGGF